jgi:pyruvate-formate lyase-activating enzyme
VTSEHRPFTQVIFEATNACNFDCVHCLRDPGAPAQHLPVDFVEHVLDQGRAVGLRSVALTGGEPTIHPEFADLLALIARQEYRFSFVTNGWTFLDWYPALQLYCGMGALQLVTLSLDGATAETHDSLRREGSFRRVMQALSVCHARGLPFSLQLAVNRRNLAEMEEFALLGAMLEANPLYFAFLQPTPMALAAGLMPRLREARRARHVVNRLAQTFRCDVHPTPGFMRAGPSVDCPTLRAEVVNIDCRGRMTFCCQLSGLAGANDDSDVIADLTETPLAEALADLVDRVADFRKTRLADLARGRLQPADEFPCQYCARRLGKLGWLAEHPESEWAPRPEN